MSKSSDQWIESTFANGYESILRSPLSHWLQTLPAQLADWYANHKHGDLQKWVKLLGKLPNLEPNEVNIANLVSVGDGKSVDLYTQNQITGLLKQFMPWRKGPFHIHGVDINTEWRSDWKWNRVSPHISSLQGRYVLDVGCGSGYHLWRMKGAGARHVVGIDPTQLFFIQFHAIKHFLQRDGVDFYPLGIEQMAPLKAFDTVFSMGVLYHRKDPMQFLTQLKDQLRPGGELVLETLVVDGDETTVLMAGERYAQMRNVWFLPSVKALIVWLQRLGFVDCKLVDINVTTTDEQRATEWMTSQSLVDFLDTGDQSLTVEGYPAPQRAVIVATKKG